MAAAEGALAPAPKGTVEPASEPAPRASRGPLERLARVGRTLLRVHATQAQRELSGAKDRVVGGVLFAVVGALLLLFMLGLLHAAAVAALMRYGVPALYALLEVSAVDLLLGLALLLSARSRLSQPLLPETRRLFDETAHSLLDDG